MFSRSFLDRQVWTNMANVNYYVIKLRHCKRFVDRLEWVYSEIFSQKTVMYAAMYTNTAYKDFLLLLLQEEVCQQESFNRAHTLYHRL